MLTTAVNAEMIRCGPDLHQHKLSFIGAKVALDDRTAVVFKYQAPSH